MQDAQIIQEVVNQVQKKLKGKEAESSNKHVTSCGLTEFIGTAFGDSIGLVIANVDEQIRERLGIDPKYRSLGIVGARVGRSSDHSLR